MSTLVLTNTVAPSVNQNPFRLQAVILRFNFWLHHEIFRDFFIHNISCLSFATKRYISRTLFKLSVIKKYTFISKMQWWVLTQHFYERQNCKPSITYIFICQPPHGFVQILHHFESPVFMLQSTSWLWAVCRTS